MDTKSVIVGIVIFALFGSVYFFTTAARYEGGNPVAKPIEAEIIGHHRGIVEASPRPYFNARLESGVVVKIYDNGQLKATYKGPVKLQKAEGNVTGKIQYLILESNEK